MTDKAKEGPLGGRETMRLTVIAILLILFAFFARAQRPEATPEIFKGHGTETAPSVRPTGSDDLPVEELSEIVDAFVDPFALGQENEGEQTVPRTGTTSLQESYLTKPRPSGQ